MSLVFLVAFIMILSGKLPAEELTNEFFYIWALFSIADALWVRLKG